MTINIVFDYGHGSEPYDARGFIGDHEGKNNFVFGKLVKPELERFEGVVVHETRPNIGDNPELAKRATLFNHLRPELYISWHSNAFNGKVSGVEVFDRPDKRNADNTLLYRMVERTSDLLGIPNRGVKEYKFAVLGNGNNAKTKMLLEMFFHDNPEDVRSYWKKQKELARAYAIEIANYYKLTPKHVEIDQTVKPVQNDDDKEQNVFTWKDGLATYTVNGQKQVGFKKLGGYTYYFRPENGYLVYGGFYDIGDSRYYFRRNTGTMATGWQFIDNNWYWFRGSGSMVTGVQFIDGKWHYFDALGKYQYTFTKQERIK